jgi:hypothetical protein
LIEDFAGWADEDVQEKWEVDIPTQMPSKPSLSPLPQVFKQLEPILAASVTKELGLLVEDAGTLRQALAKVHDQIISAWAPYGELKELKGTDPVAWKNQLREILLVGGQLAHPTGRPSGPTEVWGHLKTWAESSQTAIDANRHRVQQAQYNAPGWTKDKVLGVAATTTVHQSSTVMQRYLLLQRHRKWHRNGAKGKTQSDSRIGAVPAGASAAELQALDRVLRHLLERWIPIQDERCLDCSC